jgi:hypothetical protein
MEGFMHAALSMALINLDHPAHFLGIGPFQVSVGNFIIILSMFLILALAIFIPFPHGKDE